MLKFRQRIVFSIFMVLSFQAAFANALSNQKQQDAECLGLAMYWEARGEGYRGMLAVGSVVLNRVGSKGFPDDVCGVVFDGGENPPCQFSWWCDGKSDRPTNKTHWQATLALAEKLLNRGVKDPTHGALFFHSKSVHSAWHQKRNRTTRIGNHIFYR